MNPYEVLGVDPGATPDEVRRAYLALARRHHPDAGGDAAAMRQVNEAWRSLSSRAPSSPPREPGGDGHRVADDRVDADEASDDTVDVDDSLTVAPLSPRFARLDTITLVALLACVASAALSFLFGMIFMSGPLLGFCVFSLFLTGVLVVARTLLAMGFHREPAR